MFVKRHDHSSQPRWPMWGAPQQMETIYQWAQFNPIIPGYQTHETNGTFQRIRSLGKDNWCFWAANSTRDECLPDNLTAAAGRIAKAPAGRIQKELITPSDLSDVLRSVLGKRHHLFNEYPRERIAISNYD